MEQWDYMPWYGMIFGPIMMIVVLGAFVVVVVLIVRWLGGGPWGPPPRYDGHDSGRAMEILKERFARGEIDKAEFEDRRRLLER